MVLPEAWYRLRCHLFYLEILIYNLKATSFSRGSKHSGQLNTCFKIRWRTSEVWLVFLESQFSPLPSVVVHCNRDIHLWIVSCLGVSMLSRQLRSI